MGPPKTFTVGGNGSGVRVGTLRFPARTKFGDDLERSFVTCLTWGGGSDHITTVSHVHSW